MASYTTSSLRALHPALWTVLAGAFLVGCGTIIHGGTQDVSVSSEPSGATVEINGTEVGDTPLTQSLDRGSQHTIEISMDGYQEEQLIVDKSVSGWVAGNIVFGGLVGLVVDAATGGMYKLTPTQVRQTLDQPAAMKNGDEEDALFIGVVMEPKPEWKKIGQLEPVR